MKTRKQDRGGFRPNGKYHKSFPLLLVSRMPAHLSQGMMQGLEPTWEKIQKGDRPEGLSELGVAVSSSRSPSAFVPFWRLWITQEYVPELDLVVRRNVLQEVVTLGLRARCKPQEIQSLSSFRKQELSVLVKTLLDGIQSWAIREKRVENDEFVISLFPDLDSGRFVRDSESMMKNYRTLCLDVIDSTPGPDSES